MTSSIQVSELRLAALKTISAMAGLALTDTEHDESRDILEQVARIADAALAMKAAEPLAQGDEVEAAKWRIWERALELELPLVQADAEELARAALVRSKPTISATQTRGSCSVAALRPVARDYWVRPLVSVGDWVIVQDANDAEADPWVVSREKWDRARTLAKDEERHA